MSEPIWTNVYTRVPALWLVTVDDEPSVTSRWLDVLGQALVNGDLLIDLQPGEVLADVHTYGEGNYGLCDSELEEVLQFLEEWSVPYIAHDESKYDMVGSIHMFDGETCFQGRWDDGPVLDLQTYRKIIAGDHIDYESIEDYFAKLNRSIGELPIDHLLAPERQPRLEDHRG